MKRQLPPKSHSSSNRDIALHRRYLLAACLTLAGLFFAAASIIAALSHFPFISWIPDQRIKSGSFVTQYFRIIDYDGSGFTKTITSSNPAFYAASAVTVSACSGSDFNAGCAMGGTGYKVTFTAIPTSNDSTTITIQEKEIGTNLRGYTSFTLQRDNTTGTVNPPTIGTLPNQAIPLPSANGFATYKTMFVIGDLDDMNKEDIGDITQFPWIFTISSDPPGLVADWTLSLLPSDQDLADMEGPRSYLLTVNSIQGNPSPTGATTVTAKLIDLQNHSTSTAFALQVVAAGNAAPSFSSTDSTFEEQVLPAGSKVHAYNVIPNDLTLKQDLKISAFSSNTKLVPNDFASNLIVTQPDMNGYGTVTIQPQLPLPSPSPGVPQVSTITLSVNDDAYTRQSTFLYVLTPQPGAPATSFSRPGGVYSIGPTNAVEQNRFVTGIMKSIQWDEIEADGNFDELNTLLDTLPSGQLVSLDLQKEPCEIADTVPNDTWCDTTKPPTHCQVTQCTDTHGDKGFLRAVPWDSYLQTRRRAFLVDLAADLSTDGRLAKIGVINPNIPGMDTGIRNVNEDFEELPGYSRQALLSAIQTELRNVQDLFLGKPVQVGFFEATDRNSSLPLWRWLYRDANMDVGPTGAHLVALADEFNGVMRPRVNFYQENLAAARTPFYAPTPTPPPTPTPTPSPSSNAPNYITPLLTTAYTVTPTISFIPSFAYYNGVPTLDEYNNGIAFMANTVWSDPFLDPQGLKLIKTIDGSPNDAMEGAFNTFLSQYLEIYMQDIEQAQPIPPASATLNAVLWAGELQSWHDYLFMLRARAPIEAPAGLTVVRNTSTSSAVSWFPVYGATSYTLQHKSLLGAVWTPVSGCNSTLTSCTDSSAPSPPYAYRVQATNGTNTTTWTNVAVFLSEGTYDGFVSKSTVGANTTYVPFNNFTPQPGIRAGEAAAAPLTHQRGFVSFNTGVLTSATTIVGAKLRLNQATTGSNFGAPGSCKVDIIKGSFSGDPTLQGGSTGGDYTAGQTTQNAFSVINVGQNGWFTAELTSASAMMNINNAPNSHTQFRIYFPEGVTLNIYEGWYSGESSGMSQPQLIVQYKE